ncbi:MAG: hypothetical protein ACI8RD_008443 [Bacillariaceae sp.]
MLNVIVVVLYQILFVAVINFNLLLSLIFPSHLKIPSSDNSGLLFQLMASTENIKNLRHRTSLYENNNNNNITGISISEKAAGTNNSSNSYNNRHMAYSRRTIATPYPGGGNGNAFPKSKNLTSYRNKILIILVVTSFYTSFLYQRGQCNTVVPI